MKYKLLLAGKCQTVIDDFFYVLNEDFACLTTSLRTNDILNHIRYFQPDAFVYCMAAETNENIQKVVTALGTVERRNINFFLIGDAESCNEFKKVKSQMVDLVMEKPILASRIREEIMKYFTEKKERKEREDAEAAIQERAQKAIENIVSGETQDLSVKHILVIDDDPLMLRVIKEELKGEYNVATAISGKIGLSFLQRKKTDLILLDYEMPEENGPMVLEKLRANEATRNIPVVFLTGIKDREKIKQVLAMKPQGYLLKPIARDKLMQAITQIIG